MNDSQPDHLQEFASRVRALLAPFGSIARAAKELGIPANTLRRACAGLNEPQAPLLMALSTQLNVSMSYLLGLTDDPTVRSSPGSEGKPELEMASVPNFDARVSAGSGAPDTAVAVDEMLPFPVWMLRRLAPPGARLAFMRARGDSMQPLFNDGALLLVNENETTAPTSAQAVSGGGDASDIFVFEHNGALRVKRLRHRRGEMLVISENRRYDPELLRGPELRGLTIVGRVVWWDDRL